MAWFQIGLGVLAGLALASFPLWPTALLAKMIHSQDSLQVFKGGLALAISIPAGLLLMGASFYSARQWVEGKPMHAVLPLAVLACTAAAGLSSYLARNSARNMTLQHESQRLRREIAPLRSAGAEIYAVKMQESHVVFYLGDDVGIKTLRNLEMEPAEKDAGAGKRRAWLINRGDIEWVEKRFNLPVPEKIKNGSDPIVVFPIPDRPDWPQVVKKAREDAKKKKQAGAQPDEDDDSGN